jgi:hypothetical protein
MRVNISGNRRIGRVVGWGGVLAALALAFAPSAHALELRDMFITFDATYESKRSDSDRVFRTKSTGFLTAIAGTIVMPGVSILCHGQVGFDLVYKPGAHSGTVGCPIKRVGTSTSWMERSGAATFSTNTIVAGNVVTLQGTMEAKGTITSTSCVGPPSSRQYTHHITQLLKVRIVGRTCQVLQFHQIEAEIVSGESTTTKTGTTRLVPGAKCTLIRPSEQPPPGPPPALGDARGNC